MGTRLTLAARRIGVAFGLLVLLALSLAEPAPNAHAESVGKVYWTDSGTGKISRANLNGSGVEDLITGLDSPQGIALDSDGGKMYWVETGTAPGKISRANLDGTGVEVLIATDCCSGTSFIALDVLGGKMYWTSSSEGKVKRANLDGSGAEDIAVLQNFPGGIAIDAGAQKVYWTYLLGGVRRANLDGSGVETVSTNYTVLIGLALDAADGWLYATHFVPGWMGRFPDEAAILRIATDGSDRQWLKYEWDGWFSGVAVGDGLSSLFWADSEHGVIGRWPQQEIVTGLDFPVGVALDISGDPKPPTATPTITPTPPPPPVGGIALGSELGALPASTDASGSGAGVPIAAAAVLGAAMVGGAALLRRRLQPGR